MFFEAIVHLRIGQAEASASIFYIEGIEGLNDKKRQTPKARITCAYRVSQYILRCSMKRAFWVLIAVFAFVGSASAVEQANFEPVRPLPDFEGGSSVTYSVKVICDLKSAIAAGKYDEVNGDITPENFPEVGCKPGRAEVILVSFGKKMLYAEVLAEFDRQGLRPAALSRLLAIGARYPELQSQYWIVALGSVWRSSDNGVYRPTLDEIGGEHGLYLYWVDPVNGWGPDTRFVAIRK